MCVLKKKDLQISSQSHHFLHWGQYYINSLKPGWRLYRKEMTAKASGTLNDFTTLTKVKWEARGRRGGGSNTTPSCSDMKINNTLLRFCCTVQTRSTVIKPREEDIKDHKPQAVSVPRWCNTDLLQGSKVCWLASTHSPPVRTRPTRPDSS